VTQQEIFLLLVSGPNIVAFRERRSVQPLLMCAKHSTRLSCAVVDALRMV